MDDFLIDDVGYDFEDDLDADVLEYGFEYLNADLDDDYDYEEVALIEVSRRIPVPYYEAVENNMISDTTIEDYVADYLTGLKITRNGQKFHHEYYARTTSSGSPGLYWTLTATSNSTSYNGTVTVLVYGQRNVTITWHYEVGIHDEISATVNGSDYVPVTQGGPTQPTWVISADTVYTTWDDDTGYYTVWADPKTVIFQHFTDDWPTTA